MRGAKLGLLLPKFPEVVYDHPWLSDATKDVSLMRPHSAGLILNSVPKSGTGLLARILSCFIERDGLILKRFLTEATANDPSYANISEKLAHAHLVFSPQLWARFGGAKQLLLLRNPEDVCLSHVRFYASTEMLGRSQLTEFIRDARPHPSVILRFMLTGWSMNGDRHGPVLNLWRAISNWAGLPNVMVVTYEELLHRLGRLDSADTEAFFSKILAHGGIDMGEFQNWRYLVKYGSDPAQSATHSSKFEYLVPMDGFPSEDDLSLLRFNYAGVTEAYRETFLHGEMRLPPLWRC